MPRSNSTTFASLSPAPLSLSTLAARPSSRPFHSHSSRHRLAPLPFPFFLPVFPFPSAFSTAHAAPPCLRLRLLALTFAAFPSRLRFRPSSYRPPNPVATLGSIYLRDAVPDVATLKVEGLLSAEVHATRGGREPAAICGAIISSRGVASPCAISRESRYRDGHPLPRPRVSISVVGAEDAVGRRSIYDPPRETEKFQEQFVLPRTMNNSARRRLDFIAI